MSLSSWLVAHLRRQLPSCDSNFISTTVSQLWSTFCVFLCIKFFLMQLLRTFPDNKRAIFTCSVSRGTSRYHLYTFVGDWDGKLCEKVENSWDWKYKNDIRSRLMCLVRSTKVWKFKLSKFFSSQIWRCFVTYLRHCSQI